MLYSSIDSLKTELAGSEFEAHLDSLAGVCKRTYQISIERGASEIAIGASKIGGYPDAPEGFVWPECMGVREPRRYLEKQKVGSPLWFIGQIRTSELAGSEQVPSGCLLSFFAAVQRDGFPETGGAFDDWRVHCFPETNLQRITPPPLPQELIRSLMEHDYELPLDGVPCFRPGKAISLSPFLSLPAAWLPKAQNVDPRLQSKLLAYLRTQNSSWLDRPLHLCLGFPQVLNLDLRTIGTRVRKVNPLIEHSHLSVSERVAQDKEDDEQWVLLAQFDTDENIGLYWPGWGRSYFVIRNVDLAAGAFHRAVLINDHA